MIIFCRSQKYCPEGFVFAISHHLDTGDYQTSMSAKQRNNVVIFSKLVNRTLIDRNALCSLPTNFFKQLLLIYMSTRDDLSLVYNKLGDYKPNCTCD